MSFVPGAVLDPGIHWNGEAGWVTMNMVRWHWTVGVDSTTIGRDRGYFGLRIAQDGTVFQYSPDSARDFDACEWNPYGKGIEVESLDGSITPQQITSLGYVTQYLLATFGIPAYFYDGPRIPVGFDFHGVINHRALHQQACDEHYDGFDQSVWDAAMRPTPLPSPKKKEPPVDQFPSAVLNGHTITAVRGNDGYCYAAHREPNGTQHGFVNTGDAITSWPEVVSDGTRIQIMVRGHDANFYVRDWTPAGFGAGRLVGGPVPNIFELTG